MTPGEIRRLYFIIRTFLSYGLDELIPRVRITLPLRVWRRMLFWMPNRHKEKPLGERLRLALQELGPVWIKFGQMLSTRRDLFPPQIADQLAMLQDRVAPFDGALAKKQIEQAMGGIPVDSWFDDFEITPLASASIAQVHTARLKENGREVVIKVIRPDILPIIKADMKLIYRLARWVPRLMPDGRRLRPLEVVREYEKTLIDELNLLRESANAIQLRRNFEGSPMLYVPEVFSDYCSQDMMVMERIYGIPVSDIAMLHKQGTNMKLLAERGVQVFFTQVFRDSFFHADMHPGNIFVSYEHPEDPQYIGIDCGIVGSLNKEDKRYLAENFIAFFNRDYRKVAELHVDSGWVPPDTNVEDFEFAIRTVCEPIFEKPLAEISFGHVLLNLFNTARRFNMEVQPQLVLLQKTLLYVEGLGRQLYPQLDLWKTAKPFLEDWIKDQVGIPALIRSFKEKAPFWIEKMPELPELMYDSLRQGKQLQHSVDKITRDLQRNQVRQAQSRYLFGIGATLMLSGTLLLINKPEWELMPAWLMAGGIVTWLIGWRRSA
ncbi:ubiquinone biosynthesis monooxygenase [Buttiauxella brennerae ATCC 51605]|jgi:ubiquinone biosynthesis protein|uniref:Probable protein kinase UbiB n=1 Tax=Buttiauxella brennerae ATCC 51605 TaxID=1354251 RepID=A0A1B7IFW5_9ENTR|nr:ubiquinone biosynthesis regulatory protein kinase UbiB [Buttiauxella brennerae]OAT28267.1 ubiquinone biosynthesis monooxygenase [Buttiauxella brennerae ATCC 51605]